LSSPKYLAVAVASSVVALASLVVIPEGDLLLALALACPYTILLVATKDRPRGIQAYTVTTRNHYPTVPNKVTIR
jgi:hypothetical protein